jgi:RNA polymerase sigma factor (sigma-70 family)
MIDLNSGQACGGNNFAGEIARIRRGDQAAARDLVRELYPRVVRIARAHLPRRVAEEDLTQEIFMKIFSRLDQYRGDAPFSHWVSRIAVTTCINHLRAQRCRPELRRADLSEREAEVLDAVMADRSEKSPVDALAARELVETLLARLKPDDRLVLVLFELQQKTIAEVAAATGWSFELVKMRVFRARRKLRRMFSHFQGFDGDLRARTGSGELRARRAARRGVTMGPLLATG